MILYSWLHKVVFSVSSIIYILFFPMQTRKFRKLIMENKEVIGPPADTVILDIGCGTGAFTYALNEEGYSTIGTDISGPMMFLAERRNLDCVKG
ncbi:MAG TPA: hypothetical protein DCO79_14140, partial [Spirochaeta sp.]|nr:hypothetical protein [Spirochaeta sp.]